MPANKQASKSQTGKSAQKGKAGAAALKSKAAGVAATTGKPVPNGSQKKRTKPETNAVAASQDVATAPKAVKAGKSDRAAKPAAAASSAVTKAAKPKKQKLVRDSFTMPESEYALLGEVKKACLASGYAVKKSELLRVGVALIRTLDNASLRNWIESLPPLKAGRPRKDKQA